MTESELENEYAALLAYAYRVCATEREAEEIVSDTMLSVLTGGTPLTEIENPAGYLRRIFHRRKNDRLREKYREVSIFRMDGTAAERMIAPTSRAKHTEREEAAVRRELGRLAAIHREVMIRYYMNGESVAQIAEAMGIPAGTVKFRLSAGRRQVKDGITCMENYGKNSYAPQTLSVGIWGWNGEDGSPFSLIHSSLLAENILICAYEKPISVRALSAEMGVPAPYLEAEIGRLIEGELMGRTPGGLVYTRMFITSAEREFGDIPAQEALAEKNAAQLYGILAEACGGAMESETFRGFSEKQKATMMLYMMNSILSTVQNRIVQKYGYSPKETPLRPRGGSWLASGRIRTSPDAPKSIYARSGPAQTAVREGREGGNLCILFDGAGVFGEAHWGYGELPIRFSYPEIAKFYASFVNPDIRPSDGRIFEMIPEFERLHILRREADGRAALDIPALAWSETEPWRKAEAEATMKIHSLLEEDLRRLFEAWVNPVPAHVDEAKYYRHAGALDAFGTAVLLEIVRQKCMPWRVVIGETPLVYLGYRGKD